MNPSLFSDTCGLPQYLFYRMGQFLARLRFPFLVHAGLFLCISSIPHFKQFNPCHMILCHQMTADTKYIYLHRCQNKKTLLLVTGMCVALSVPQGDKGKVASPPPVSLCLTCITWSLLGRSIWQCLNTSRKTLQSTSTDVKVSPGTFFIHSILIVNVYLTTLLYALITQPLIELSSAVTGMKTNTCIAGAELRQSPCDYVVGVPPGYHSKIKHI